MQVIPAGTQIVGFSPELNMTDKKSSVVNKYQQAYTIEDLASAIGGQYTILTDGVILGNTPTVTMFSIIPDRATGEIPVNTYFGANIDYGDESFYGAKSFIEFKNLVYSYLFSFLNTAGITSIVADELVISSQNINLSTCSALTSFSFASLQYTYNIYVADCGLIEEISFPEFIANISSDGGGINIFSNAELVSVSVPKMVYAYGINIYDNPKLENIVIGTIGTFKRALNLAGNISWVFSGNALTEESVDAILALAASLDGTNGTTIPNGGTIDLSGGTSAPPSVAGLANKTILEGRGITVTVNVAP